MKKSIFILLLSISMLWGQSEPDSLEISHFALELNVTGANEGYLNIFDNEGNTHFKGLYRPDHQFQQILVLPVNTESLYIALADSVQVKEINNEMSAIDVVFENRRAGLSQRLLWLKHDLEKLFPIIAILIIVLIKKKKDAQNEESRGGRGEEQ